MDRGSVSYLVLHYVLLIGVVLGGIAVLEQLAADVPFWLGLVLAIAIGFGYPRVVRHAGVAPERWE